MALAALYIRILRCDIGGQSYDCAGFATVKRQHPTFPHMLYPFFLSIGGARFCAVSRRLGPKLVMIARMAADCLVFLTFAVVVIFAYGFASQAVLNSAATPSTPRHFAVSHWRTTTNKRRTRTSIIGREDTAHADPACAVAAAAGPVTFSSSPCPTTLSFYFYPCPIMFSFSLCSHRWITSLCCRHFKFSARRLPRTTAAKPSVSVPASLAAARQANGSSPFTCCFFFLQVRE